MVSAVYYKQIPRGKRRGPISAETIANGYNVVGRIKDRLKEFVLCCTSCSYSSAG